MEWPVCGFGARRHVCADGLCDLLVAEVLSQLQRRSLAETVPEPISSSRSEPSLRPRADVGRYVTTDDDHDDDGDGEDGDGRPRHDDEPETKGSPQTRHGTSRR